MVSPLAFTIILSISCGVQKIEYEIIFVLEIWHCYPLPRWRSEVSLQNIKLFGQYQESGWSVSLSEPGSNSRCSFEWILSSWKKITLLKAACLINAGRAQQAPSLGKTPILTPPISLQLSEHLRHCNNTSSPLHGVLHFDPLKYPVHFIRAKLNRLDEHERGETAFWKTFFVYTHFAGLLEVIV